MANKRAQYNHMMGIVSKDEMAANDKNRSDFENDLIHAIGDVIYKYNETMGCNFQKRDADKALKGFWETNKDDILDMLDMEDENDFGDDDEEVYYDPTDGYEAPEGWHNSVEEAEDDYYDNSYKPNLHDDED